MYRILVDGSELYNPLTASEGTGILNGTADAELGLAGTANISIPPNNPLYAQVHKMKSLVQVVDGDEEIFCGRVIHDEKDFMKNKSLYLEGQLAFLIDYIMPPYDMEVTVTAFLAAVLGVYNTQAEQDKQIQLGSVTILDAETVATFKNVEFTTIQDTIYNTLIDVYGGYLRIRYSSGVHYLDYMAMSSETSTQVIRFGENLMDLSEYITTEDTVTVVIPLGAMQEQDGEPIGRVNITTVTTGGVEYVTDLDAAALYGNIWRTVIWEDVTDPAELKTLGEDYLAEHKAATTSITISAIDLHTINPQAEPIRLGDLVRVVSAPHNLDEYFQCTRVHVDFQNPKNCTFTLGAIMPTISGMMAATDTALEEGTADSTLRYMQLAQRVAALENRTKIQTTEMTTVADIYAAAGDLSVSYIYLNSDVANRPGNVGGTLAIYRLTALYGMMTYYANNGNVYTALQNNGTLDAWKQITVSTT